MRRTLKVLFLAADPFTQKARLELGEEMRAIDEAIQRGSGRDAVELVSHFATRTRDLQYALLRHEPDVVHFAGHGGREGVIYLGDEHGQPRAVTADALRRLFCIVGDDVRAVVLNACHTLPVVEALSEVVDFAVGTNRPILDETAISFAAAFYGALAFGRGVRQSFELAVNQLEIDGSGEVDVPVLRARPGAADGPLLPPDGEDGGESAGDVHMALDVEEIGGKGTRIIADDYEGSGAPGYGARQEIRARTIAGEGVEIIGRRKRDPGRA